MSLTGALTTAQSALANASAQSALISKNIANVSNANYSIETATTITQGNGTVSIGPTQRATNAALLINLLSANSASASSQALSDGLQQISSALNLDTSNVSSTSTATDTSPSTLIGAFTNALQQYQAQPDDVTLSGAAVSAAKALVTNLNQGSASVQTVRAQADSAIASSVQTINSLLTQFQTANNQVIQGNASGSDVSTALDARDGILKQLSSEIGITTVPAAGGGLSIYTDSGATLFETTPRTVAFTPTNSFAAGTVGNAVTVDGVPVTGASAIMPIKSGRLAGLTTLRDQTTVQYQNQLDQMAASLVTTFAESDQTSSGAPTVAGLFTSAGLTTVPITASQITGLSASLKVAARVDPSQGGTATNLRDGNISSSSAAYTYNTSGDAGYSNRIQQLLNNLATSQTFDASSGGAGSATLANYAASSVSWLESARQSATHDATSTSAAVTNTTTTLSNATGVNLDDQMSQMLDVEHAYQASAQLLNTVNSMFSSLLSAFN